ncbi:MAG: hypothetical protein Q8K37_03025 [Alphaproteobacteria bacterium]|nr:hypothetical protein [Alphaproteobacteria bacterium]
MIKHSALMFFLILSNFGAKNLLFADNTNDFGITYAGGKSMSSSPATTGTTSVPSTRYSTPPYGGGVYLPFQYRGGDPLNHYLEKRMEKKQTKKQIRKRNNDLLRLFGIP